MNRYATPEAAEADIMTRIAAREVVIGFGHPVYTIADPRNKIIKDVARRLSAAAGDLAMFNVAERIETVMGPRKKMFANLDWVFRSVVSPPGHPDCDVHTDLRDGAHRRLGGTCDRAADRRQDHPADGELHRSGSRGGSWLCRTVKE